jgi:hypothetical protein
MTFTVGRSDIKALKFEIPMMDESGNAIFDTNYKATFFNL